MASESISYIYSANGEKLAKRMKDNSWQYYADGFVYNNDKSLNYFTFEEGRVKNVSRGFSYEYHLKDHLSNTRVTFEPNGSSTNTQQVAEYYPFGSSFVPASPNNDNKYLYNGKEKQDDVLSGTNLDWYDYGSRFYGPDGSRFYSIDPLAEKYPWQSPYAYAANNPIRFIDFNGLYPKSVLVYDPNIGLYGGYHFTQSVATLLYLVSGVSKFYIQNAIIQERAPGQYRPFYSSDKGGGAITLGTSGYQASITYTQNFFADDPSAYDNHGYGQNIHAWLALSSHEVGHLPQIDEAGGLLSYVGGMIKEYAQSGHDDAPSEKKADEGYKNFTRFNSFVDNTYGAGALTNLFNSDATEGKKTSTIEKWYGAYQDAQNAQKKEATQSFINNYQNLESGKYKWDGSQWVKQ